MMSRQARQPVGEPVEPTLRRTPWSICSVCKQPIDTLDRCGCDYQRNPDADLLDKAFAWGHEDATEGADMQGSVYFVGEALANYNEGYAAGLEVRRVLEGPSDELAFMSGVLESLRRGKTPAECALADAWLA